MLPMAEFLFAVIQFSFSANNACLVISFIIVCIVEMI